MIAWGNYIIYKSKVNIMSKVCTSKNERAKFDSYRPMIYNSV